MKSNHCTLFCDRLNIPGLITYDISGLCLAHDLLYSEGYPRHLADREFYDGLCRTYPEYKVLWIIVYRAVRSFGWLFYITKKHGLPAVLQEFAAEKVRVAITASLKRYAERETGRPLLA